MYEKMLIIFLSTLAVFITVATLANVLPLTHFILTFYFIRCGHSSSAALSASLPMKELNSDFFA